MIDQNVIPVISDFKAFEKFLLTNISWCILMDFHINHMEEAISKIHQYNKHCFVHMDMIHGIASDEYGTQFICQRLKTDGIISIKPKVIEMAKKNHKLAVLRLFMIDTRSIEKGCAMANKLKPDFLEVLPATTKNGIYRIKQQTNIPVIAGGLLESINDIEVCLKQGAQAVTSSSLSLCISHIDESKENAL